MAALQTPKPKEPEIAPASNEATNAMQLFVMPRGVRSSLFAAEPDVANPVAIDVDPSGRVFVCESFRQERGVEDNRNHPEWLNEDLAAQTVADRLAYIKRHLKEKSIEYTYQDDRIRLLVDSDGDGDSDKSTIFANHFNAIEEGTGAGVLFDRGNVYFTCIPRLWKLNDKDNDGVSDTRTVLHDGFGVRFAFRGHDLHGLNIGPDGRLYFSIGDRGYHISDDVSDPGSGAVFRCEPDGSNLEVIATGLRNPQELAFDDYGNLFTGDNNSDSGDKARMVYVVEGSDSGWRMAFQYLPDRGPFNREKIWHPYDPETTPAYIVPPIDNFADGPSGFAYYPGTGFSDHMNGRFLLCDFRGQTSGSGIKTFRLKPKGAFFEIVDEENTFWNILATDCCFGPDGRLYVSDWVHGWDGIGKGRIYTFTDVNCDRPLVEDVEKMLATGFSKESDRQLVGHLSHRDRRIRQNAQFELVRRKQTAMLLDVARRQGDTLPRLHALWGIGQLFRDREPDDTARSELGQFMIDVLADQDDEISAQVAKLCGELGHQGQILSGSRQLESSLQSLCDHVNQRVVYFAIAALGKTAPYFSLKSYEQICTAVADNADRDPLIRHAGIIALSDLLERTPNRNNIFQVRDRKLPFDLVASHNSVSVRLAAVVAIRKVVQRNSGRIAEFECDILRRLLNDNDAKVKLEAARAIYDLPIPALMNDLAQIASQHELSSDALARRALNANFRLGGKEQLSRVTEFINDDSQLIERRVEAVEMLGQWKQPPPLDRVLGMWRPFTNTGRDSATKSVNELFVLWDKFEQPIANQLLTVASEMNVPGVIPTLENIFNDDGLDPRQRSMALSRLVKLKVDNLDHYIQTALKSEIPSLRIEACRALSGRDPQATLGYLGSAVTSTDRLERQSALRLLGGMSDPKSASILQSRIEFFDEVPVDSRLDLINALKARPEAAIAKRLEEFHASRKRTGNNLVYDLVLEGGDANHGSEIFYTWGSVSCLRCHKINGDGGDVGPDLSDVGKKRDRKYLAESLLEPSKTITEEFETIVVLDVDGLTHIGVKKSSDNENLTLITAEGNLISIPQNDIEDVRHGKSAMPDDVSKHLTLDEIRDLIEFLALQKPRGTGTDD